MLNCLSFLVDLHIESVNLIGQLLLQVMYISCETFLHLCACVRALACASATVRVPVTQFGGVYLATYYISRLISLLALGRIMQVSTFRES